MSMSYEDFFRKIENSPFVPCTVDIIIEIDDKILLIERKYPPLGWAIPGGFVEKGESLEAAAAREAKEETGLEVTDLKQFRSYSDPKRDPRFHTIATVFTAKGSGSPEAQSDAINLRLFNPENLPDKMAFDHSSIIRDYLVYKKSAPVLGGNTSAKK